MFSFRTLAALAAIATTPLIGFTAAAEVDLIGGPELAAKTPLNPQKFRKCYRQLTFRDAIRYSERSIHDEGALYWEGMVAEAWDPDLKLKKTAFGFYMLTRKKLRFFAIRVPKNVRGGKPEKKIRIELTEYPSYQGKVPSIYVRLGKSGSYGSFDPFHEEHRFEDGITKEQFELAKPLAEYDVSAVPTGMITGNPVVVSGGMPAEFRVGIYRVVQKHMDRYHNQVLMQKWPAATGDTSKTPGQYVQESLDRDIRMRAEGLPSQREERADLVKTLEACKGTGMFVWNYALNPEHPFIPMDDYIDAEIEVLKSLPELPSESLEKSRQSGK